MAKNLYWKYVLTGGGTGALDAIDGDELADLDSAVVVTLSTTYLYSLDDDSGAEESSPDVITPDINAGTKRWILTNVSGAISTFLALSDAPASYSGQVGKFPKVNVAENALEFAAGDHILDLLEALSAESWAQQFNNLLSAGGFASWSAGIASIPDGWTAEATPAYLRATVDVGYGLYAVRLTTDAVNEGINQTLLGLKPSTKYTIQVRAKATAEDTARLFTTGATTNIDVETTSTSWVTLKGTFTTDGSGTNVVVKLVGKASGDIVWFCGIIAVEGTIAPAFAQYPNDEHLKAVDYQDSTPANFDYGLLRMECGYAKLLRLDAFTCLVDITFGTAFSKLLCSQLLKTKTNKNMDEKRSRDTVMGTSTESTTGMRLLAQEANSGYIEGEFIYVYWIVIGVC